MSEVNRPNLFQPSSHKVVAILKLYGLNLHSYTTATSGMENRTLLVQSGKGNFVLRVYRDNKNKLTHIKQELEFVKYLYEHGIKTIAVPLQNIQGELLTKYKHAGKEWYTILMPHMPGEHTIRYTETLLSDMATTQSTMHILAADFKSEYPVSKEIRYLQEGEYISRIGHLKNPLHKDFITRAEAYRVELAAHLPRGFCHLDFDYGNILSDLENHITAVLDFDDIAVAPYVLCLAYTLWDIFYDGGQAMVDFYLQEYEKIRPLSELEKAYVKPCMLFRHYVIGSVVTLKGKMNNKELEEYLSLENQLSSIQ